MDHVICINLNSFPAESSQLGIQLFEEALQGVLGLQEGNDRFLFYLDSNNGNLFDMEISKGFTYEKFITECDHDLAVFLSEIEDKSPALDNLSEEQLEEMTSYSFYVPNESFDIYPDVYALTWAVSGYLLSINTHNRWDKSKITIARADEEGRYINEVLTLKNISTQDHGLEHYDAFHKVNFEQLALPHIISPPLLAWFNEQTPENKTRIIDKVSLAYNRQFKGAEPLFKPLGNGMREIRFSAYSGGAIRILFKPFEQEQQVLLVGFIKHSDSEGYKKAIEQADQIYETLFIKH
ncbi:MAG: hypothetical protein ACI8SR_003402 [Oceanicoccus sp.]|jgi:hypothetical protein|uniref:type II toxin-antitoxin system RelE/ParE family toxin n=1 Tax=Marinomonas primoryensis TaxID=178399 RepID=UPI003704B653